MTIRPNTLPVSCIKIQWRSEKIDDRREQNDNYNVINALFDDRLLGSIWAFHISRKRGKGAKNGV